MLSEHVIRIICECYQRSIIQLLLCNFYWSGKMDNPAWFWKYQEISCVPRAILTLCYMSIQVIVRCIYMLQNQILYSYLNLFFRVILCNENESLLISKQVLYSLIFDSQNMNLSRNCFSFDYFFFCYKWCYLQRMEIWLWK